LGPSWLEKLIVVHALAKAASHLCDVKFRPKEKFLSGGCLEGNFDLKDFTIRTISPDSVLGLGGRPTSNIVAAICAIEFTAPRKSQCFCTRILGKDINSCAADPACQFQTGPKGVLFPEVNPFLCVTRVIDGRFEVEKELDYLLGARLPSEVMTNEYQWHFRNFQGIRIKRCTISASRTPSLHQETNSSP
jgi:hypothetical protein